MQSIDLIFSIAVLIMSVVVHEVSHGYMANYLGDRTAKYAGRLTLNPIKHLDLFGSIIVPFLTSISGFIFGWAKPVPYNPYNLKKPKRDEMLVAIAGPLSNISISVFFGLIIRFGEKFVALPDSFISLSITIVIINLVLAVFNLVPIPPLDGSKVLFSLLPYRYNHIREFLERNGIFVLLFFIFFIWSYFMPIITILFRFITGYSL